MARLAAILLAALPLAAAAAVPTAQTWTENRNYVLLNPVQSTNVAPGKVEVLEVFSYGCPACNNFEPIMTRLRANLPSSAQVVLLPAAFIPAEDWPTFQRAYFAAESLGIAERTHQLMFDAVWKTGELATMDQAAHTLKNPMPTIQDAARFYARVAGVKPETFLGTANSFVVDMRMKAADAQITAMEVPGTPCIVVAGKYRVIMDSVHTADELIELVKFLVSQATKS